MYYCKFCNKTVTMKLKSKHECSKSHLYNAKYITEEVIYHNILFVDVGKILFDCVSMFKCRFNEFFIKVKCEINDKLYSKQKDAYWRLKYDDYVVRGTIIKNKKNGDIILDICRGMHARIYSDVHQNIHRLSNVKRLTIQFIADYDKMTIPHYLQQPRSILECQLIKHIKNKRKINKRSFAFILNRYEIKN